MSIIDKLFNTKKSQAESKFLNKCKSIELSEWLLKIPDGSYKLGRNNWINVERKDNTILLVSTTDEHSTNRGIRPAFTLTYDSEGLRSCYHQLIDVWPSFIRGSFFEDINSNKENIDKTQECVNFAMKSILKNAKDFYHLPSVNASGETIPEKETAVVSKLKTNKNDEENTFGM